MGATLSGSVFAAAFTGTDTVDTTECPMLKGEVSLGVSQNVHGMWFCDEQYNVIKVGACHEGGSRKAAVCAQVDDGDGDSTTIAYNYPDCNASNIGTIPANQEPDYKAFVVGSSGGTVAGVPLGGRCDDTSVAGLDFFN